MTSFSPGGRDSAFATNLDAIGAAADGRQILAILRRSANGSQFQALRALDRVVPRGASDWDFDAYALVAGLYAVYHQGRSLSGPIDGDLGASFARLGASSGWEMDRAARRLTALLAASRQTLGERLRHATSLLKSASVPIDWARLAHDVREWDRDGHPVQRRWARSFVSWRVPAPDESNATVNVEGVDQ